MPVALNNNCGESIWKGFEGNRIPHTVSSSWAFLFMSVCSSRCRDLCACHSSSQSIPPKRAMEIMVVLVLQ